MKITWRRVPLGSWVRWHLCIGGRETPWFISRHKHDKAGDCSYRLCGAGMSPSGCARDFGWFHTLAPAKAKALELAEIGSEAVDRVAAGNSVVLLGDRVTPAERSMWFFYTAPRVGKIIGLTTGLNCTVQWDGEDEPAAYRLNLLKRIGAEAA